MRRYLTLFCMFLLLTGQTSSYAQSVEVSSTNIYSSPSGAEVTIDNRTHGKTPLQIRLPIGVHTFKFASAGYPDQVKQYLVFGAESVVSTILSAPQLSPAFINFTYGPFYRMWATNLDVLVFSEGQLAPNAKLYTYHPFTTTLTANPSYPDAATDPQIPARLDYVDGTVPHASPSGRFIAYFSRKKMNAPALLDTKTNRVYDLYLSELFYFPPSITRIIRITWSPNEQYAWVGSTHRSHAFYLAVEGDTVRFISLISFKDAEGNEKSTDMAYGRPTDDGRVIVSAVDYAGREPPYLWVVDLNTRIGQPIPIRYDQTLDAGFTDDGKRLLIALSDRVIQYDVATQKTEVISTALSTIPAYFDIQVEFSDSMRFAYVYSTSAGNAWLYSIYPDKPH